MQDDDPHAASALLPTDGSALLAFKAQHEAAGWGAAGVVLDDPATRLAELDEFFEADAGADGGADEAAAVLSVRRASEALAAATTAQPELA
eukprot:6500633-Prymnesium_polylepis.1